MKLSFIIVLVFSFLFGPFRKYLFKIYLYNFSLSSSLSLFKISLFLYIKFGPLSSYIFLNKLVVGERRAFLIFSVSSCIVQKDLPGKASLLHLLPLLLIAAHLPSSFFLFSSINTYFSSSFSISFSFFSLFFS